MASPVDSDLAQAIDGLLPQTQCTRCGFPSCRDYAEALARGESRINRCPPGGEFTINALSELTGQAATELDPECGAHASRQVVRVDENWCIGCTLCIQACPVEAIIGGAKRMHTVIESLCTGCELCIAPCPVDCLELHPARLGPMLPADWLREHAPVMRARFAARDGRLGRFRARKNRSSARRDATSNQRRAAIADAVARTRARRRPAVSENQ